MSTIASARIVANASVYPMTTTFLSAIRAPGASLSADGSIIDAAGSRRWCFVNASGNWDLTATSGIPIDRQTFSDLKASPAPYRRAMTLVTLMNGTKIGVTVMVDPGSPIDPG